MTDPGMWIPRLRKAAEEMRQENQPGWPITCEAAAHAIEQLRAERDEARRLLRLTEKLLQKTEALLTGEQSND